MFRRIGPRASQPQEFSGIDWTHPVARGLVGAWVPTQGPGNLAISGGSRLFIPTSVEASGPNLAGRFVGQISNDGAVTNASALGFAIGLKTGTAAVQSVVLSRGSSSAQFGFHANHSNPSYAGAVYSGAGFTIIGKPTGAALADNTRYDIGARIAASNGAVYSGGVKTATNASAAAPGTSSAGLYFASDSTGGNTWTADPWIEYLFIWNIAPEDWVFKEVAANPWQIFEPQRIWVPVFAASSGSSGTSATTNAADTSSASGTTTVIGSSAKTNANDTSSASGTTTVTGTSAKTNADDTSSASGAVGSNVTGTSATTNAADTSAASGTTTVVGTSSKTNGNDTASANGTTTVVGTSAQTNANDTATASGAAGAIVGTAAVTNANDYASANGVAVGSASNAAGRPTRRRYVVEIDGQDFIVESPDQARQLLDKATEAAEEKAEQALDRANKAQKRPQRKVMADARKALREPSIYAPEFPELAADVQRQIRAIYDSALQAIEISALLRKREEDEMDDEDILLLL